MNETVLPPQLIDKIVRRESLILLDSRIFYTHVMLVVVKTHRCRIEGPEILGVIGPSEHRKWKESRAGYGIQMNSMDHADDRRSRHEGHEWQEKE